MTEKLRVGDTAGVTVGVAGDIIGCDSGVLRAVTGIDVGVGDGGVGVGMSGVQGWMMVCWGHWGCRGG